MAKSSALSENDSNRVLAVTIPSSISAKDMHNNNIRQAYKSRNLTKSNDLENLPKDIDDGENLCSEQTEEIAKFLGHFIVGYVAFGDTSCPASYDRYVSVLRPVVDTTIGKHQSNFDQYIDTLELDNENTRFSTLCRVFDLMIDRQPTWERIVVLFSFCGWLAKHFASRETAGKSMADETGDFLGTYVTSRLGKWIDDQGGWDQFPDKYKSLEKKAAAQLSAKRLTVAALLTATAASVYFCIS